MLRGGEGRKTLALRGLRLESREGYRLFRGGEGRKTLAPQGLRLESRGSDIAGSAEVRVARRSHCGVSVWNPGRISLVPWR